MTLAAEVSSAGQKGNGQNNNDRNKRGNQNAPLRTVKIDASVSEYTIESVGKNSITSGTTRKSASSASAITPRSSSRASPPASHG